MDLNTVKAVFDHLLKELGESHVTKGGNYFRELRV